MVDFLKTLAWFAAGALLWGGVDLLQVALSIGGQPLGALVPVVLGFYVLVSALAALLLSSVLTRLRPRWGGAVVAAALVLPGFALAIAYVNFVHLPGFFTTLTLAANATLALTAGATALLTVRSAVAARVAHSRVARITVAALGLVFSVCAARGWARPATTNAEVSADDRPNVFIIVIDSLRADRVRPADGSTRKLTPALAGLADRGLTFQHAYAQASWTKPSVASILTSLFPSTHGANLRRDRLSSEAKPLAETFARNGYRTALFSANPWISPAFGFDRGVEHFFETEQETFGRLVLLLRVLRAVDRPLPSRPLSRAIAHVEQSAGLGVGRRSNCERDRAILAALSSWLAEPAERPIFAYLHLMSPHIPYEPPSGTGGFEGVEQVDLLMRTEPLDDARRDALIRLYDETVTHADSVLAEVLDVIRTHDTNDRSSVVVVTADHGEEFFEHGRFGHGKTLYDEVIHVPLVIAGPGVPAGQARDEPAMLADIAPTLAKLVGIAPDPSWVGHDLLHPGSRGPAYAELIREGGLEAYMSSDGRRKYVEITETLGAEPRSELFDLKADPAESRTIPLPASDPLRDEMLRVRASARAAALAREATAIDESAEERLRALGYIN